MVTSKFQVEKFTGENDFHLWQLKMRALLVHQVLKETLGDPRSEKKPNKLSDEEMQDALDKAYSTLILSLRDRVLREVGDQTTATGLWKIILDLEDINVKLEDEDKNLNKTLMWHMRLGHMSEKWMKILERHGVLGDDKLGHVEFCESSMVCVYLLKGKNEVFEKFKQWKALVETQIGRKVKRLRTDNGLEFCNQQFDDFCAQNRVVRHKIVRHTPQQNGLVEGMNRTLMDKVRCLLIHSKFSQSLWAETLMIACYLVNRSPSSAIDFKTPIEMWLNRVANYSDLKIFGCPAFAHVKQGKFEPRALKCVFLGYPEGVKGYRLWCTDLKPPRCIVSRDVVFNEQEMLKSYTQKLEDSNKDTGSLKDQINVELTGKSGDTTSYETSKDEKRDVDNSDENSESQTRLHDYQSAKDREMRVIRAPKKYAYADLIAYALTTAHELDYDEPKSYKEYVSGKNTDQWSKAMKEEIDSLYKNDTWGISGVELERFKARLVAKGFTQKEGIDFTEVFSLVVRHGYIRIIMSLVAVNNMHLEQMDVKTTFLHGELQEHIVMAQLEGFIDESKANWKFQRCNLDCCVYLKEDSRVMVYLVLYVDDMLIACVRMSLIEDLKQKVKGEFDIKDLGPAKKILGMQLHRNRNIGTLFLSQEEYIIRVLDKFGIANSKPVQTPLAPHFGLSEQLCPKAEDKVSEMMNILMQVL
ncbi:hypothetical protein KPL70_003806 [Citrus sinensis]|nr:hypothetical protein KPL70_003806 [Citrus sinensis]